MAYTRSSVAVPPPAGCGRHLLRPSGRSYYQNLHRLSVSQSVSHTSHFCPSHISATVALIHAKMCTHTPWLPSFLTLRSSSATMRQILAKHIFGQCSYRFCPKIYTVCLESCHQHLSHLAPPSDPSLHALISRLGSLTGSSSRDPHFMTILNM